MSHPSFGELGGEDPFAILGVPSGAGDDEIRSARRRLLRRYHPDLPGGDLQRTQMITAAAHILLDPLRRRAYQAMVDEAGGTTVTRPRRPAARTGERGATVPGPRSAPRSAPGPGPRRAATATAAQPDGPPPRGRHHTTPGRRRRPRRPSGPAGQHADPDGTAPPPWSALAIVAALVTLTCTPVSLVLGLAAYVQIRRTGRRGLPLAVYGIVAGVVLLVVYALMLLSSLGSIGGPAI